MDDQQTPTPQEPIRRGPSPNDPSGLMRLWRKIFPWRTVKVTEHWIYQEHRDGRRRALSTGAPGYVPQSLWVKSYDWDYRPSPPKNIKSSVQRP